MHKNATKCNETLNKWCKISMEHQKLWIRWRRITTLERQRGQPSEERAMTPVRRRPPSEDIRSDAGAPTGQRRVWRHLAVTARGDRATQATPSKCASLILCRMLIDIDSTKCRQLSCFVFCLIGHYKSGRSQKNRSQIFHFTQWWSLTFFGVLILQVRSYIHM
jgi:hypothetical protein